VAAGGTLSVGSGGSEASTTVAGTVAISSGGTGSGTTVTAGGSEVVSSGGTEIAAAVSSGGTLSVLSGGTALAATLSGGTEIVPTGAVVSGVTFSGPGGDLVISATSGTFTAPISGFVTDSPLPTGNGDLINLAGFGIGAMVSATAPNTVTVTSGGTTLTLDVAGVTPGETFVTTPDPAGGIDVAACFLDGTHILTPDGERVVEDLSPGDLVTVRSRDGRIEARPIKWIGRRSLRASELPEGERHPVRIMAGAFGQAAPHRDLLITPEHCVFVDGRLVPARMLVNGRSIVVDRGIGAYTVHHLELEEHAILFSEGLKTESWLDTGNRTSFSNAAATALRPDFSLHEGSAAWADAAAPLAVDRAFVEPIWDRLRRRADVLGLPAAPPPPALTHDAGLHLVTDRGWTVRASEVQGDRHLFLVPTETTSIRLVSRASRPSEVTGPFLDDRRRLGVLVGEVRLRIGKRTVLQTAHLTEPALRGWYDVEGGARWTSGDALLPIDASLAGHRPLLLEVQVLCAGPYLADDAPDDRRGSAVA
jgi:autotransporter passenger strand-loop-strand repeat protein